MRATRSCLRARRRSIFDVISRPAFEQDYFSREAMFTVALHAPTATSKNRRSEDPKEERHTEGCRTARRAVERGNDPQTQAPADFWGVCVCGPLPRSHAGPMGRRPAAEIGGSVQVSRYVAAIQPVPFDSSILL